MSAQDHPEPPDLPMVNTNTGIWCMVHGIMDCTEPWCYRCGNHEMDAFDRCADPRCRATNSPLARKIIADVQRRYSGPVPVEVLAAAIAHAYTDEPVERR